MAHMALPSINFQSPCLENIMRILNFQRWKLPPSNFSMTFKDSIWKEDILTTKATTNTLSKDWKFWKKSLTLLKLDAFNNSKTSFPHTSNFQWIKELSLSHFLKLESWSSQQLKELSSKHFHLETWYFQKLK